MNYKETFLTIFLWIFAWTTFESILVMNKVSNMTRLKICVVGLILVLCVYSNEESDDNE